MTAWKPSLLNLVGFVFFHRFSSTNFGLAWLRYDGAPLPVRLLGLIDLLEYVGDHRRGDAAAVYCAADFALVQDGKRILWLIGG
jgi:hypothetical protein